MRVVVDEEMMRRYYRDRQRRSKQRAREKLYRITGLEVLPCASGSVVAHHGMGWRKLLKDADGC